MGSTLIQLHDGDHNFSNDWGLKVGPFGHADVSPMIVRCSNNGLIATLWFLSVCMSINIVGK